MSNKRPKWQIQPSTAKTPNRVETPSGKKTPTIDYAHSPESINQKRPVWRMGMIDFEGQWGWGNLNSADAFKTIQNRLKSFETMTWGEIATKRISKGSPQNHFMPVSKICKDARDRLKELNLDDLDELYSLRFAARERLWGIRQAEILYILWWDHNHSVFPMQY
ncbi:MAG: hypothetical protein Q7U10_08860 [Thermodesulfovibrionia bacterium]|nr:hypothetical protein [Thermodesulfovibrionia bacterium]